MEECNDASGNMPFDREIQKIVRSKCATNLEIIMPSYVSFRNKDETLAELAMNRANDVGDTPEDSNKIL